MPVFSTSQDTVDRAPAVTATSRVWISATKASWVATTCRATRSAAIACSNKSASDAAHHEISVASAAAATSAVIVCDAVPDMPSNYWRPPTVSPVAATVSGTFVPLTANDRGASGVAVGAG